MSQHDMDILNASGAAVRADLNLALKALASTNAGTTAPATTFAYQLWVDTSVTAILKIRNGANSAWIVIGDVTVALFALITWAVGSSAPSAPVAYQPWVDTSGSPALLKLRNSANTAWITVGNADATNLALLALAGGTLTGSLSSSNTDFWKMPVGTTGQRPGSPAAGMIRYNSSLNIFEGYGATWAPFGGGGGGGSISWVQATNSPTSNLDSVFNQVFNFQSGLAQALYTTIKVPQSYVAGSQIKLYLPFYSPDSTGTGLIQTVATLIKPATDIFSSVTNQRTSTNSAVTLGSGTVNIPQMVTFDLTASDGKINSVAVAAGDTINITLSRGTDTGASDLSVLAYTAELTIQ